MWNLIQNEWEKIPQSLRTFIEIGVVLVFNSWLLDHWNLSGTLPCKYLGKFDLREISYNLGMTAIYVSLGIIVLRLIISFPQVVSNYKNKYPTKNIGKTFELVWFNGKLMLFEHKKKLYYHVYPWETAQDLDFISYGTHVEDHFPNPNNVKVKLDSGKMLDTSEYKNGGSINTTV